MPATKNTIAIQQTYAWLIDLKSHLLFFEGKPVKEFLKRSGYWRQFLYKICKEKIKIYLITIAIYHLNHMTCDDDLYF